MGRTHYVLTSEASYRALHDALRGREGELARLDRAWQDPPAPTS